MNSLRRDVSLDLIALLISLATVVAVYLVGARIYERMPHFEDEMAYVWQAQAIAAGDLVLPSPPQPKSFLVPFVFDHNGVRTSKYPPGWPALLALGILVGARSFVNPILAGLGIWLSYRLAVKVSSPKTGLLAVLLLLTSPLFWLLSGSLLSHAWSLVLTLGFALAWLDTFLPGTERPTAPAWMRILVAGFSLGLLTLTRPVTALAVGMPFLVHGVWIMIRGDSTRRKHLLAIGVLALSLGSMVFAWQYVVTGDALRNPYSMWWAYDRYGFGEGFGRFEEGHNLEHALENIKYSLREYGTGDDLLGWGDLWWVFLPFGAWALRGRPAAWLVVALLPATILAYIPYWIGSWQYGPRYYYEGMLSITVLTAAGICWLFQGGSRIRKALVTLAVLVLIGFDLGVYLPGRLHGMRGMYAIRREMLAPFTMQAAERLTPALVIVSWQDQWTEYGGLLELQNAQLSSPFIFILNRGKAANAEVIAAYPERRVIYYYPDEPDRFYDSPR